MRDAELDDIAANVTLLIQAELDVQHRLGHHPAPVTECSLCRRRLA